MTSSLSGRIALVTGASRGIGAAVAKAYAKAGAHVIITARTVGALERLDDDIRAAGGNATILTMDLLGLDDLDKLGPTIYERFGKLDIFVGNDISPNMIAKKLLSNFRILCASPQYLAINSEPDDLDELVHHSCLVIKEREQSTKIWKLRSPMEDVSTSVTPRFISNNSEIIKQLALEGQGIMLCSVWDVIEELHTGKLQHIMTSYWQDADIWAVYPSRLRSSSKLKTCILFIQTELLNRLQHINRLTPGRPIVAKFDLPPPLKEKVFL